MENKNTKDVQWAPVVGYEKEYLVSTDGRVYSIRRGKQLKPRKHKSGYLRVNLCKGGFKKDAYIHRLVCEAFLGLPKDGKNCVNHLDEDKTNNQLSNLEWTTQKENIQYSWNLHKEERIQFYKNNHPADIPVIGYDKNTKEKVGQWKSMSAAAHDLQITVSSISKSAVSMGKYSAKGILFFKINQEKEDKNK